MRFMASLFILVTATGGCATDSSKDTTEPAPDAPADPKAWPCASTTSWGNGARTRQAYRWDEHHNLLSRTEESGERYSWSFDPTGTIEVGTSHLFHEQANTIVDSTDRELVGGRIMTERSTRNVNGNVRSSSTTRFRYEGAQLVEKQRTGTFPSDDVRTQVWYEAPASHGEIDYDGNGKVLATRSWNGDPWTVSHSIGTDRTVDTIVTRRLDADGRELHREENVYHSAAYLFVDVERRSDGAPLREVWLDKRYPDQSRTVTYETACSE